MAKHVLVTGGAGFIGSHVVDAYLERGWRVTVVDDLSSGDRRNLNPRAAFMEGDIRKVPLDQIRPDVINHHAAQMDVRRSVADPLFDAEVNVVGSLALLQKALGAGVNRFIFASSGGAIYGEPQFAPQTEQHPTNPLSPYGCAKLAVEHYLNYFRVVHGLSTVALRYANVYGPRQNSKGEAGVVAIFIDRLQRGEKAIINGDGRQTRDFVYVADVVAANMHVTDSSDPGPLNVGTGVETSVNQLASLIGIRAEHGPAKIGEQRRSVLASQFGRTALADGLRETLAWFKGTKRFQ
ncbi:MAG TPA: NAD-dependent epimerase/dehydratase family protein [Thermoanaerobaculia bacterium]|nr:NAD-dependent epimerase/dehydratase family protein [Thermoanaerobaculia bacterium]